MKEKVAVVLLICILFTSSCSGEVSKGTAITLPQSIDIQVKKDSSEPSEALVSSSTEPQQKEYSFDYNTYNLVILNAATTANIYKVNADVSKGCFSNYDKADKNIPANAYVDEWGRLMIQGYYDFNSNILSYLYGHGEFLDNGNEDAGVNDSKYVQVDRKRFADTANSLEYVDSDSVPEEITGFAQGIDLYSKIPVFELYGDDFTTEELTDWGEDLRAKNTYPMKYYVVRQEIGGLPVMPIQGDLIDGKMGYGQYVEVNKGYAYPECQTSMTNGKNAVFYSIVADLSIDKELCKDLEIMPFEEIMPELPDKIMSNAGNHCRQEEVKQKIEDISAGSS